MKQATKQIENSQKNSSSAPEPQVEVVQAGPSRKRNRRRRLTGW